MKRALGCALTLVLLVCGRAAAQHEAFETVELRVSATGPGAVAVVDRGASDGLEVGDRVSFRPRDGATIAGVVLEVADRSSLVELFDPARIPPLGCRGDVRIPAARLGEPDVPVPDSAGESAEAAEEGPPALGEPQTGAAVGEGEPATEHPPWENEDEEWEDGSPLLAQVAAVRPWERARKTSGRLYADLDGTRTSEDDRSDHFLRTGADARVENPFGRGGLLQVDGELNHRATDLPDRENESEGKLRIDRLAYSWGGTRFEPERWEVGRFLQRGMPEFGVIDGVEWGRRLPGGDRWGAGIGFMPEPDADFESGHDWQVAAYYRWVQDERERLSATGGIQKTFHDGATDRDLLVGRVEYLPPSRASGWRAWDLHGTLWIDYYSSGDEGVDAGFQLTRAHVSTGRRYENGSGSNLTYSRQRFPSIDRYEFTPIAEDQIGDDRTDRLGLSGWRKVRDDRRLHGRVGVWDDEEDSGGDVQLGVDFQEVFSERDRLDLTVFFSQGLFSADGGARLTYGRFLGNGRYDVLYEITSQDQEGFEADNDDLLHHRLRASRDLAFGKSWNVSIYGEGTYWEDEGSFSLGAYLQRSF